MSTSFSEFQIASASLSNTADEDAVSLLPQSDPIPREEIASMIGVGIVLLDTVILCLALGQLVYWLATPPGVNPERLSLGSSHAIAVVTVLMARLTQLILFRNSV